LRCGRCGNENDDGNRFCGMCGAALVGANQAAGRGASAGAAGSGRGSAERGGTERSPAAVSAAEGRASDGRSSDARADAWTSSRPVISGGPSLLGLNVPGSDAGSGRGDSGRDPLRPSSSVEYLLEDDEEESHRSWGKLILIVAALALAVGFGYLRWKGVAGFDWISGGDKKPAAVATQTPDAGQSGADSAATPAGGAAAQDGGASAPVNSASGPAAGPAESGTPQNAASQTSSQDVTSQSAPAQNTPAQTASQGADQQSAPQSDAGAAGNAAQAAGSSSDQPSPPVEAPHRAVARKPPAAIKPAAAKPLPSVDSVTEAERYIYGRGVGQDCDRGLRLLKAGAQSNVRAMISMGALYSTGTCTPRDLPTAYRWFALALHKEPDNQALQNDLQSLWSRMTPPERQLAIKLSQ